MSVDEVKKIHNYFNNVIGKRRVGMFVSEMRRQIGLEMIEDGADYRHIAQILCVDRTSTHHFKDAKMPKKDVEDTVRLNMHEWIEKGLIPKTIHNNYNLSMYVLVDNIDLAPIKKNSAIKNKYDGFIEEICN